MYRIESLLAARQFVAPQLVGDRLYFISNLSGQMSLYAMDYGGSVPEPLIPPHIALQNPHLMQGDSFYVFPALGHILVMIDRDGDENYQPTFVPIDGGFPQETFDGYFKDYRVHMGECDPERNLAYFLAESRQEPIMVTFRVDLAAQTFVRLAASPYGMDPDGVSDDHSRIILSEGYTVGDHVIRLWREGADGLELLYGRPLEDRQPGEQVPLNAISDCQFVKNDRAIIFATVLFDDTGSLGYLDLDHPDEVKPVEITGIVHTGTGELDFIHQSLEHLKDDRYLLKYNIDGVSWLYEGRFNQDALVMKLEHVIAGRGEIADGVLESAFYDKPGDRFVLSYSTATSPTQLFTIEGPDRRTVVQHTCERVLGIPAGLLSAGEDASYTSFDGLRVSARLYLPAESLGYEGPRPLVYYVHGGPQSQERPDFSWFSMPLIQMLTLRGFAVFVPNVRGSMGYGLSFTKHVDRDWGGSDRLDHVHAMTEVLPHDPRVDVNRAGVVGRSYGGFMTLTLAFRHPELWKAAIDMFGPYDLLTFIDRIPPTWQPYFKISVGDPEKDKDALVSMSPRTYIEQLACPMLVIQGANDPRVIEQESRDVVEQLNAAGKEAEIFVFEDEGHDVLKYENRVTCYNLIVDYFEKHLEP